jgi:transcriptional regulator with XRE-family HTH domain
MTSTSNAGKNIRKIRELKGLSQENIAHEIGFSQANYSKLERGEIKLTTDVLQKIIEVLGVSLETLLSFDESYIFNHCQNCTGNNGNYNISQNEKYHELFQSLLKSKDDQIERLLSIIEKNKGS